MSPSLSDAAASFHAKDEIVHEHAYLLLARNLWRHQKPLMGLWPVPLGVGLADAPASLGRALASLGMNTGVIAPPAQWEVTSSERAPTIHGLGDGIDSITPSWAERTSYGNVVERTLDYTRGRYRCVLCDLSGLSRVEAHEVASLPNMGIVMFVARGRVSEFELARYGREIAPGRLMGAVLMDGAPPQIDGSV